MIVAFPGYIHLLFKSSLVSLSLYEKQAATFIEKGYSSKGLKLDTDLSIITHCTYGKKKRLKQHFFSFFSSILD